MSALCHNIILKCINTNNLTNQYDISDFYCKNHARESNASLFAETYARDITIDTSNRHEYK